MAALRDTLSRLTRTSQTTCLNSSPHVWKTQFAADGFDLRNQLPIGLLDGSHTMSHQSYSNGTADVFL